MSGFAEYTETEVAGTLKAKGGDIGGGSETIIIESDMYREWSSRHSLPHNRRACTDAEYNA